MNGITSLDGVEGISSVQMDLNNGRSIYLSDNPVLISAIALSNTKYPTNSIGIYSSNSQLTCVPQSWPTTDMNGAAITHGICPTTLAPTPSPGDGSGSSDSAAIAIGVLVAILVLVAAAYVCFKRKLFALGSSKHSTNHKPAEAELNGLEMGQLDEVEDSAPSTVLSRTGTYCVVQNVNVALRKAADLDSGTTDEVLIPGQTFEVDRIEVVGIWGTAENGGPQTFLRLVTGGWAFEFHPTNGKQVCELVMDEKLIDEARKRVQSMYTRARKELKYKIAWTNSTIETANATKKYDMLPGLNVYLDQLTDLSLRLKKLEPKTQSGLAQLLGQQSENTSVAEQCMLLQQLEDFLLSVPDEPELTSPQYDRNLTEEFDMGIALSTNVTTVATSNISKYSLGQQAAAGNVAGTVIAIRPGTPGATTGPGKLDIRNCDADASPDIYSSAKYTIGKLTTGRPEQSAHGLGDYMGLDGNDIANILKQGEWAAQVRVLIDHTVHLSYNSLGVLCVLGTLVLAPNHKASRQFVQSSRRMARRQRS
jgi:hypothetical protein